MLLSIIRAVALAFVGFSVVGFSSAHATSTLYKRECNGCHSGTPTCNGCHAHGVHNLLGEGTVLNLVAKTDKQEYVAGDDITVTLSGGSQPLPGKGWVGVKLYDDKGVELGHVKTELPATLTTRAYAGTTKLYMSWIGFDYEREGGTYGAPMGDTFGAGQRLSFLAGLHKDQPHIEEVVATNSITVGVNPDVQPAVQTEVPPVGVVATGGESKVTDSAANASSGGGSIDLIWVFGAGLLAARRRRRSVGI